MTTLKEYKAMMEGATDAPWIFIHENYAIYGPPDIRGAQGKVVEIDITDDHISNANFIAASRNLAPELIRIIELAEISLSQVSSGAAVKHPQIMDNVRKTISEIRKLKGE